MANNKPDLNDLLSFVEVAETGSFTRAATHLGLSKSTVSQQVSRLEHQLGQQLMVRHTRALSLTPAGATLFESGLLLRDQYASALRAFEDKVSSPSGELSMTVPVILADTVAGPALARMAREYPRLRFRLDVSDTRRDLVRDRFDVALAAGRLPDSDYKRLPVGEITESLYASPDWASEHTLSTQQPLPPSAPWITGDWQPDGLTLRQGATDATCVLAGRDHPPLLETNNLNNLAHLCELGLGCALLPEPVAAPLVQQGRLVDIMPGWRGEVWPTTFLHIYAGATPPHIKRLHELVRFYYARQHAVPR
ncbi:LysR family transcriptional regulator [Maricaulis sp. D1M11]|uniref:LysR family transcriptional regulator n=1 Tax=Maricaulis sp. D1M11 TaxID=3076117 RepID=UPI0039B4EE98